MLLEFWVYNRSVGDGTTHPLFFNTEGEALAQKDRDEEEFDLTQRRPYREALLLTEHGRIIQQETWKDIKEEEEEIPIDISRYQVD